MKKDLDKRITGSGWMTAFSWLANGHKIRRRCWVGRYLVVQNNQIFDFHNHIGALRPADGLAITDFSARDWVLA